MKKIKTLFLCTYALIHFFLAFYDNPDLNILCFLCLVVAALATKSNLALGGMRNPNAIRHV